jgi:hypothetical protein
MSAASSLILTDKAGEDRADDLLAALSEMAYATTPRKDVVIKKEKRFKSRFFFVLSDSIADEVEKSKKKVVKKELDHIDDEVETRLKELRRKMPKELEANIKAVREFFLTEIGPRTLAGGAGSVQAKEVVQRLLGTPVDGTQFAKFERMSHEAVNIRMAKFIARYYKLPQRDCQKLLESIMPRPVMFPIPNAQDHHERPRHTKKDKKADTTE